MLNLWKNKIKKKTLSICKDDQNENNANARQENLATEKNDYTQKARSSESRRYTKTTKIKFRNPTVGYLKKSSTEPR